MNSVLIAKLHDALMVIAPKLLMQLFSQIPDPILFSYYDGIFWRRIDSIISDIWPIWL